MANRRHDVVAVQITDRYELELPALGRLILEDAETGEIVEVNTGNAAAATRLRCASKSRMKIWRDNSVRPALTPFNFVRTKPTRRRWEDFLRTGRNGGCADEFVQSSRLKLSRESRKIVECAGPLVLFELDCNAQSAGDGHVRALRDRA